MKKLILGVIVLIAGFIILINVQTGDDVVNNDYNNTPFTYDEYLERGYTDFGDNTLHATYVDESANSYESTVFIDDIGAAGVINSITSEDGETISIFHGFPILSIDGNHISYGFKTDTVFCFDNNSSYFCNEEEVSVDVYNDYLTSFTSNNLYYLLLNYDQSTYNNNTTYDDMENFPSNIN